MNLVYLDGYTLNPGDLSWETLEKLGNLKIYDRTSASEVVSRSREAEIILTNKVPITREMMEELPDLKHIAVTATGYNIIDLEAAKEHHVIVTHVKGYSSYSVAQHTFALLFALTNRVETHDGAVQNGKWEKCEDFTFRETPLVELYGKTLGLIGLGDIGEKVAEIGAALGMEVIVYRKNTEKTPPQHVEYASLEDIFSKSDVISLHCPLTAETKEIVNKNHLNLMKDGAFILNTGRGALIQEQDLAQALKEKRIAGAGLDVLSEEPPKGDNPLLHIDNCIITPHIAWSLDGARKRLMGMIVDNIKAYQEGAPINVVR